MTGNSNNSGIMFSVVITTRDRPHELEQCLRALCEQNIDPGSYEIVIVFDGHQNVPKLFSGNAVCPTPRIMTIHVPEGKGPAHCRNAGTQVSNGKYIAFLDDDCLADSGWLKGMEHVFDCHPEVPGVFGRVITDKPIVFPFVHSISNDERGPVASCNLVLKKEVFINAGGFDERFTGAGYEDTDLILRVIRRYGRLVYAQHAVVTHVSRYVSIRDQVKRRKLAEPKMLFRRKHPGSLNGKGQFDLVRRCLLVMYHFLFFAIVPLPVQMVYKMMLATALFLGFRTYQFGQLREQVAKTGYRITHLDKAGYIFAGWLNDFVELYYTLKGFGRYYLNPGFREDNPGLSDSAYAATMLSGALELEKHMQDSHSGNFDDERMRVRSSR